MANSYSGSKIIITAVIFVLFSQLVNSQVINEPDSTKCKIRLPDIINNYQPALVPAISLYGNKLYFDRKEHPDNVAGIRDQDDIWYSEKNENGAWQQPQRIPHPLNSPRSDVLFSISPDGRSALSYGTQFTDSGFVMLEKTGKGWEFHHKLDIKNYYNKSDYFYGYLSADGNKLFLSLQRDDGFGGHDLYISKKIDSATWGIPQNLGPDLNSEGTDAAPFLAFDGVTLYFSSDGIDEDGKMDLYMSRRLDDSWEKWSKPVNLGPSVNTMEDEKSIYLTALGDSAYVVSWDTLNRRRGIYKVCIPEEMRPEPYVIVEGTIFVQKNGETKLFDKSAQVSLINRDNEEITTYSDPETGTYIIIDNSNDGHITPFVTYPGYECGRTCAVEEQFFEEPQFYAIESFLKKCEELKVAGVLSIGYFETNSAELNENFKEQTSAELLEIDNKKGLKFIVSGYADERGTEEYNEKLSRRRAENAAEYLTSLGIGRENIEIRALGESKPVSDQLSENRRVVIIIE